MFYSQDILQKRGGKFGIIWIAATRASSLTKRDYSSVNVAKTCDEIINHLIGGRSRARYDRGRLPRFSLYLSAQLMFGVTLVHGKHAEYLVSDAITLQSKFFPKKRLVPGTKDIDMPTPTRPMEALRLEDPLDLYKPGLVELDPEFGLLRVAEDMMEPSLLPDIDMIHFPLAPPTPPHWTRDGVTKPPSPYSPAPPPEPDRFQVRSSEDISLRESDDLQRREIVVPGEVDLEPPQLGDMLYSTEEEEAAAAINGDGVPPGDRPSRKRTGQGDDEEVAAKRKKPEDRKRKEPDTGVPEGELDLTGELAGAEGPPTHDQRLSEEELEVRPRTKEKHPKERLTSSRLELPPVPEEELLRTPIRPPTRPGRGPKIDKVTEISREDFRSNLARPELTLAPMVRANPKPKFQTAEQLFNQPCHKYLHPRLLHLWRRNIVAVGEYHWKDIDARSSSSPGSPPEGAAGVSAEQLREVSMEESISKRTGMNVSGETIQMSDVSSMSDRGSDHRPTLGEDIPAKRRITAGDLRELPIVEERGLGIEEPQPEIPQPELAVVEEASASPVAEARVSPREELSSEECCVSITEEPGFSPARVFSCELSSKVAIRDIARSTEDGFPTTFSTLAPPRDVNRATAARFMSICLDLCKKDIIRLHQEEPYQDITVERGPRFPTPAELSPPTASDVSSSQLMSPSPPGEISDGISV